MERSTIKGITAGIIIALMVIVPVRLFVDGRIDQRPLASEDKAHISIPYDETLIHVIWDFEDEDQQLGPGDHHVKEITEENWGVGKDFVITGFFVKLMPTSSLGDYAGESPRFVVLLWREEGRSAVDAELFANIASPNDVYATTVITSSDFIAPNGDYYVYIKSVELENPRLVKSGEKVFVEVNNFTSVTFDDAWEADLLDIWIIGYTV